MIIVGYFSILAIMLYCENTNAIPSLLFTTILYLFILAFGLYKNTYKFNIGYLSSINFLIILHTAVFVCLVPKIWNSDYTTGFYAGWFQNDDLFAYLGFISLATLVSIMAGCELYLQFFKANVNSNIYNPPQDANFLFYPFAFIALILSIIAMPSGTILTLRYEDIHEAFDSGLNSASAASLVCTASCWVLYLQKKTTMRTITLFILFLITVIYCNLLAGKRVEAIATVLACLVVWERTRLSKITLLTLSFCGAILFALNLLVGIIRAESWDSQVSVIESVTSESRFLSTQQDCACTGLITLGLLKNGMIKTDYGQTMFNVILCTFPKYIYERPEDYASKIVRLNGSPGGSFFVNEPFVAGGILGVVVSFICVGIFCVWLEFTPITPSYLILYMSFFGCLPRFIHYGWLPGYKYFLFGLLLSLIVLYLPRRNVVINKQLI